MGIAKCELFLVLSDYSFKTILNVYCIQKFKFKMYFFARLCPFVLPIIIHTANVIFLFVSEHARLHCPLLQDYTSC